MKNLDLYLKKILKGANEDILKSIKDDELYKVNKKSIIIFLGALTLMFFREPIFTFFGMGNPFEFDKDVTTLGISATIMILYNMVGWPYILEVTNMKPNFRDLAGDSKKRSLAIVE